MSSAPQVGLLEQAAAANLESSNSMENSILPERKQHASPNRSQTESTDKLEEFKGIQSKDAHSPQTFRAASELVRSCRMFGMLQVITGASERFCSSLGVDIIRM